MAADFVSSMLAQRGVGGLTFDTDITIASSGAELFYSKTQSFTRNSPMVFRRRKHTATLLNDGRVLIAGGSVNGPYTRNVADNFDPASEAFTAVSPMPTNRSNHFAVLLPNGKVLMGGG